MMDMADLFYLMAAMLCAVIIGLLVYKDEEKEDEDDKSDYR